MEEQVLDRHIKFCDNRSAKRGTGFWLSHHILWQLFNEKKRRVGFRPSHHILWQSFYKKRSRFVTVISNFVTFVQRKEEQVCLAVRKCQHLLWEPILQGEEERWVKRQEWCCRYLCKERGAAGNREVWARARDLGTHLHSRKARSLQDWPTDTHV